MLKVYGFSRVNKGARGNTRDLRVLWALEEMALPYEIVGMDHPNHDLVSPAYRAVNPFGQMGTKPSEALRGWADMRLGQLDGWLANRRFIATDEFTVAAILMSHMLAAGSTDPELVKPYANIVASLARCTDRPAWKKTYDAYCERVVAA